jgi:hypothetical protein
MSTIIETEYNDEASYADAFETIIKGSLNSYSDVDWYKFNNPYPTSLSVSFAVGSKGLWSVQIYDQNMQILSGRNIDSSLTYTLPAYSVGDYSIRIQTTFSGGVLYSGDMYTLTLERATYSVRSLASSYNEGAFALFEVTRTGKDNNYGIYYKLTGPGADSQDGEVVEKIPAFVNDKCIISVPLFNDGATEGDELLNLSLGMYTGGVGNFISSYAPITGATASVLVIDASKKPVITKETHQVDVLVDKGILSEEPLILQGLTENIEINSGVVTAHTLFYAGATYSYTDIDRMIMVTVRDQDFTSEFKKEMTDLLPASSTLSYGDMTQLVGIKNMDSVIKYIAGADGSFVD